MKPGDTIQVILPRSAGSGRTRRGQVVQAQIERIESPELFVVITAGIYVLKPGRDPTNRFVVMVQPTAWVIGDAPPDEPLPHKLTHYKLAPYALGSGQFRTPCGRVVPYAEATLDRGEVSCPECQTWIETL